MNKILSLLVVAACIIGAAVPVKAQQQVLATSVLTNATVIAADSNAVARIVTAAQFNQSKVYGFRIVDTGGFASRFAFGVQANNTNAYANTLSNGIPLAANGSITYNFGTGALPLLPLYAKTTTNGQTTTYLIEILKTQ